MTLKMLPASQYLRHLFNGFRSFSIVNMGSVGQRASKLLAVKVGGLKKKSATLALTAEEYSSAFDLGLTLPGVESFS